ncbi:MAG: twin-arginine translocase subunit TatC [Candidatus Nitrosocaldaceae archaeon]
MEEKEYTFYEHLEELRRRIIRVTLTILIASIIFVTFGIKEYDLGFKLFVLYPDPTNSVSIQSIKFLERSLLPSNVELIQTKPGEAFFAQLYVSVLLSIIFSMPLIVREITAFIAPALYTHEKRIASKIMIPTILLFISGALFAYILVIPFMLNFLYEYGAFLGLLTLLNIVEFVTFILYFTISFGISFQLPIIMYTLTKAEIVEVQFWKNNFRYAVIIFIIFGAIITPDGSGITMWFIALPMIILYLIGILVTKNVIG